jgi:hypothetical protein
MIAAKSILPAHEAEAKLVIRKFQFKNNSQNLKLADGTSGQTITHNPTNIQTQYVGPSNGSSDEGNG